MSSLAECQSRVKTVLLELLRQEGKTPAQMLEIIKDQLRCIHLDAIDTAERDVKIPVLYSSEHSYFGLSAFFRSWMKQQVELGLIKKTIERLCFPYVEMFGAMCMKKNSHLANQWYAADVNGIDYKTLKMVMEWKNDESMRKSYRDYSWFTRVEEKDDYTSAWIHRACKQLLGKELGVDKQQLCEVLWSLRGVDVNDARWGTVDLTQNTWQDIYRENEVKPLEAERLNNVTIDVGMRLAHSHTCCSLDVRWVKKSHGYKIVTGDDGREMVFQADPIDRESTRRDYYDSDE